MATAPQATMEMPQQGVNPFEDPNTMAVYDQMRQTVSPKEFGDELLTSASQSSPEEVAAFRSALEQIDMPPEVLDALNDVVDEILASPERYDELRAKYMDQGLPEEILPEQFDPQFFVALNMAIDQMIAAPAGVQAFAKGGIAELKPIAKAIASYGRNGDTMLAHITPAEARMLRRRGGSGTTNPDTGLPEFFLKGLFKGIGKALKSVGKAVKKFASSTVGRIITTVALGFFLGPAAAGFLGVGAGSVAGLAISGFVGGAGSTLLAGGSLKDALKAGAISGLTAGAVAGLGNLTGLSNIPLTGTPSTATFGQSISNQFDAFKGMLPGGAPATPVPAPAPNSALPGLNTSGAAPVDPSFGNASIGSSPDFAPVNAAGSGAPGTSMFSSNPAVQFDTTALPDSAQTSVSQVPKGPPSLVDQAKDFYSKNISPSGIQEAGQEEAMSKTLAKFPGTTSSQVLNAPANSVLGKAYQAALPGMLSTYGPMAGIGLGAMSAFGGFETKPVQSGPITQSLMKPVTQRIAEDGTQRQMYMQGLPGVVYDQYGAPIFGQSTRLPTYDVPDYNSGGYGLPQGSMSLPPVYTAPPGSIGSRSVAQPYNNSDMYPNLVPRRYAEGGYAEGGTVTDLYRSILGRDPRADEIAPWKAQFGDTIDESERATFRETAGPELASNAAVQKAARDAAAQQRAMRKSQGSGQMYANINAGLAALAPEKFPGEPVTLSADRLSTIKNAYAGIAARPVDQVSDVERYQVARQGGFSTAEVAAAYPDIGFGEVNRIMGRGARQQAYAPMLQGQRDALAEQARIAVNNPTGNNPGGQMSIQGGTDQYGNLYGSQPYHYGRGPTPNPDPYQQDRMALDRQVNQQNSQGQNATPAQLAEMRRLSELTENDPGVNARRDALNEEARRRGTVRTFMNMGGIAGLAAGGYPRRNGQINGPGTEKSDSIPAMLSDGEFVMTAKAVRSAGKGSRRAGAKQMYKLMHQLEKNSERG